MNRTLGTGVFETRMLGRDSHDRTAREGSAARTEMRGQDSQYMTRTGETETRVLGQKAFFQIAGEDCHADTVMAGKSRQDGRNMMTKIGRPEWEGGGGKDIGYKKTVH
jgi:hypothetical protein